VASFGEVSRHVSGVTEDGKVRTAGLCADICTRNAWNTQKYQALNCVRQQLNCGVGRCSRGLHYNATFKKKLKKSQVSVIKRKKLLKFKSAPSRLLVKSVTVGLVHSII
jgi:hypothetical protein